MTEDNAFEFIDIPDLLDKPHPDDPSGDIPEPLEDAPVADNTCERIALGVFHFPEDDNYVLALSTEDAVEIWREFHGHADSDNPERVDTICNPLDLIMLGDVDEVGT
jgi:hypothetical protein